jgi:hypothetical protein
MVFSVDCLQAWGMISASDGLSAPTGAAVGTAQSNPVE